MEDGTRHLHSRLDRWMIFVDGEGFTSRAEEFVRASGAEIEPGVAYSPGVFYWFPFSYPGEVLSSAEGNLLMKTPPIRAIYYTSSSGGEKGMYAARNALWKLGFEPKVFKRSRRSWKAKAASVALTTDALSSAYSDNFDIAVLVAGDASFVPLVEELKRRGKVVYVAFFSLQGDDAGLQFSADMFVSLDSRLFSQSGR